MAINPGCCRSASEKAGSEAQKGDEIMLDIYIMPEGEKSREIVKRHVNERLLKILDRAIKDYVMIFDDKRRYWKRITCSEDWEKSVVTVSIADLTDSSIMIQPDSNADLFLFEGFIGCKFV